MECYHFSKWKNIKVCVFFSFFFVSFFFFSFLFQHFNLKKKTKSGHDGWIWALEQVCPESPIYFSASVDETIRVWDVRRPNPCIHMISDFKGPVAGLSLNWEKNRIVTGSFDVFFIYYFISYVALFVYLFIYFGKKGKSSSFWPKKLSNVFYHWSFIK